MSVELALVAPWWIVLDAPAGWVVERRDVGIVARPEDQEAWFFLVKAVDLGTSSLWDVARTAMEKHVGGTAERFDLVPDIVAGRGAFCFGWTDGAVDVATWWVALSDRVAVRIEYCDPASGTATAERRPPPGVAARPLISRLWFLARR